MSLKLFLEYKIFDISIRKFSIKVIRLAVNIGVEDILYPYIIHENTPQINIINVIKDTSSAFLVLIVLIS